MKLWGLTFKLVSRNINDIIDLPPNNIDLFNGDLGKYLHILNPISYSLSSHSLPSLFFLSTMDLKKQFCHIQSTINIG